MCVYKYTFPSLYEGQLNWAAADMCTWKCLWLCAILHRSIFYKLSRPAQHQHRDSALYIKWSKSWHALIRSEEKQQYISHHLPLPCLGTSEEKIPSQSPRAASPLPTRQSTENSSTANTTMHWIYFPLTKAHHSEERTPQRKLQGMLSWPSWLFP